MRIQNPESRIQKGKKQRAGLTFEERMALVIVSLALLLFLAFFGAGCGFIQGIDSGTRTFGITNRIQNSEFRIQNHAVTGANSSGQPMELSFDPLPQAVLGTNAGVKVYCRSGNLVQILIFPATNDLFLPLDRSRPWMVSATTFTNRPFPIVDQFTNEDGSAGFLTNALVESDRTAALLGCSSNCLPGILITTETAGDGTGNAQPAPLELAGFGRADSMYQVFSGSLGSFSLLAEFQGTNGAWSQAVPIDQPALFFKTQRIGPP